MKIDILYRNCIDHPTALLERWAWDCEINMRRGILFNVGKRIESADFFFFFFNLATPGKLRVLTTALRGNPTKCKSYRQRFLRPQKEMTIQLKQDQIQFIKMKNKFCLSRHIINKPARQVNLGKLSANPVW